MEEQTIMNTPIGTKDQEKKKLDPAKVKIVKVRVELVEKAKRNKAIFTCKYPDREETLDISAVSFLDGKNVKTVGTWINLDEEDKLQKGTGLTVFIAKLGANNLSECEGKEIETELDDSGYLVFKAY